MHESFADRVDNYVVDRLSEAIRSWMRFSRQTPRRIFLRTTSPQLRANFSTPRPISGARRALEFGTLEGYSTIRLARAFPADGGVVKLEIDQRCAPVARELRSGGFRQPHRPAAGPPLKVFELQRRGEGPFDLIFTDADKRTALAI